MVASADPSMPQDSGIEGSARGEKRGRTMVMGKKVVMDIPPHPSKVKTPWTVRLFEKFGIKHTTCPHCKKESLQLIGVNYPGRLVREIMDDS